MCNFLTKNYGKTKIMACKSIQLSNFCRLCKLRLTKSNCAAGGRMCILARVSRFIIEEENQVFGLKFPSVDVTRKKRFLVSKLHFAKD